MEIISLKDIANALGSRCEIDLEIIGVCTDTRKIIPGSLFIALEGERFDGHDYIEKAFELGAAAAVSHKEISSDKPIIMVENTAKALLLLGNFYRKRFSLFMVGITGSVGKTSTKEMIYYVLSQKYKTLKTQGNLNNEIGLPMTLLNLDRSYQAAVIEMGMSNRGEISRLSLTACPNIGVITNIGVSHIENLGSRENILKAKLEILDGIIDDSPIVLNADDDMLSTVDEFLQREIIFYGINNPEADIRAVDIVQQNMTTEFDIVYYGNKVKARIPAIGIHNVYNALAAFCVGLIGEVDVADIIKGIASYKPAGMRQNVVVKEGVTVIEDCYNASPDSMKAALNVLSEIDTQGKRFAVLGDMLELGEVSEKLHFDVGVLASESKADVLVCYGEQARHIAQGAVSNGMTNVLAFDDKEDVSNYLKQNVKFGDAVLFKASRGMKLEEVILQTYGES